MRDLIHAADPEVSETIKRRNRPYFILAGNVCALLAAKDHVNIFLYDGAIVPDPDRIIAAGHDNKTARTVAVRRDEPINAAALTAMLRHIIANNRAGGWRKLKIEVQFPRRILTGLILTSSGATQYPADLWEGMWSAMRKNIILAALTAAAFGTLALASVSQSRATAISVDLGIIGSPVAGVAGAQVGQELGFTFTVTNHSTTTAADLGIKFTVARGNVTISDYICPLITTHFNINPDTPFCEPGWLPPGKSTSAAVLASSQGTSPLVVRACAVNDSAGTDPVSSNNCKTLTIPIS